MNGNRKICEGLIKAAGDPQHTDRHRSSFLLESAQVYALLYIGEQLERLASAHGSRS